MEKMKLSVLYLGRVECLRLHLVACKDTAQMIRSPMFAVLIQHPTLGNLLYDTGNSPFYSSLYTEDIQTTYPIIEYISIEDALAAKGLKPADIDMLILSHLHFDHVGGLQYFAGTKALRNVVVSEAELKNAYFSVMTGEEGAYVKSLFDLDGVRYQPISGTVKLADDLTLFVQQSHTPGVIGLILKTQKYGTVIATSDTVYTADSYQLALPPGGKINKTQSEFFDNLTRLKEMEQKEHATMLFGHDFDQAMAWIKEGWIV